MLVVALFSVFDMEDAPSELETNLLTNEMIQNFSSSNTRILRKVQNGRTVVGSQDGNMRTHWDDSAQMMDTSDEDNSAYPSSSGSPQPLPGQKQDGFPFESFRVSHFERPRPPTRRGSDPESEPRSISEADEYDREEEDGSEDHYSNDSMIWGPSGGVDDGMEGIEMEMEMDIPTIKGNDQKVRQRRYTNAFGNANAPFSPRYRSLSGNIQHYHCQMNGVGLLHPEHNQDRQQHIYQTQPFSSESSLSSSEGGAATNYNDTTRVTRWDRVQGRQENVAIMPTTVIATTTPPFQASKRKRGCNENDTDVESAALPTKRAFLGVYTRFI